MAKKISVLKLLKMKNEQNRLTWVTAYDFPFAQVAENAGIEMILVGDSGGMVQLGYQTTNPVTMDEMIMLAKSVRRGAPNTFLVGDMPQGSYEISNESAVMNAMRFVKEAGSDCIKLEGGLRVCDRVKAIADAGILVMGHLGLTPQSVASFGGYRVQGKTLKSFDETVEDAIALQEAGAFALLLEAMPSIAGGQIAKKLKIPVYGIGAGHEVDGQLVIMHDLMGFYQLFRPWFAKCYISEVAHKFSEYIDSLECSRTVGRDHRSDGLLILAEMAVKRYCEEVKNGIFPGEDYSYPIQEEDVHKLTKSRYWTHD